MNHSLALFGLLVAAVIPSRLAAQSAACGEWTVAPVPQVPTDIYGSNDLQDVEALASGDVWAVGSVHTGGPEWDTLSLAMHWDGVDWTVVPTPDPSETGINSLRAVAAVSSDDVWAAGLAERKDCLFCFKYLAPLVMHWDGSAWQEVALPDMQGATLSGIEVVGPNDVWFGGEWGAAVVVHWDGSSFEVTSLPTFDVPCSGTFGCGHAVESISAAAPDDVWAVGGAGDGDSSTVSQIWHYDGQDWTHVPGPAPGYSHRLFGVEAIASDNVYAVGDVDAFDSSGDGPFIIHWDGLSWTQVDLPSFAFPSASLWDITALAPDDIWVSGQYTETEPPAVGLPLTLHYDGVAWTQVMPDPAGPSSAWLRGISASSSCDVWATGTSLGQSYMQHLEPGGAPVCQADLGFGGPGDATLSMCGEPLSTGGSADILLTGAAASAPAWIVAAPAMNPTAFFGGVLVPVPPTIVVAATTDSGGEVLIPDVAGGLGSFSLYLQAAYLDAAQPMGVGISNAVEAAFLP